MSRKWSEVRKSKVPDAAAEAALEASGRALRAALALDELRRERGLTQVEVARALQTGQGSVSALERRQDVFISTLREYVEALGGELEVTAVFDGDRIPLELGQREAIAAGR